MVFFDVGQVGLVNLRALGQLFRTAIGNLAGQQLFDPVERVGLDDAQLVVQIETVALELVVDDLLGALVYPWRKAQFVSIFIIIAIISSYLLTNNS